MEKQVERQVENFKSRLPPPLVGLHLYIATQRLDQTFMDMFASVKGAFLKKGLGLWGFQVRVN